MKPEKLILTIFATMVLTGGCCSESGSSSNKRIDCIDCQGLRDTLRYLREEEHIEKVIFADSNKPGEEMSWEKFEKELLQSSGCSEGFSDSLSGGYSESVSLSNECICCQGLRDFLGHMKEEHAEKVIAGFESEYGHEDGGEMPWEEFEKIIIQSSGCCEGFPHPLSKEWKEYDSLDCILEYLEKENVQRIAFCRTGTDKDTKRPEDWNPWAEIVEPKKINEVLELIREAMEKEKEKFADRWSVLANADSRMQIITDKHKFIIPICGSQKDEAIYGVGWISCKLRKKLTAWGYAKPVPEKECRTLKCVLEYLEEENIQRIDFYQSVVDGNKVGPFGATYPSFEWHLWREIIEPQKINKVLKLLRKELKRGEDRINEEGKTRNKVRMQIVTDKQKYIIPILLDGEAAYGIGWTSYELREQLRKWGFDESKDANTAPAEQ